ncbi:TetR/AcrR family transcriptional regulator C-terminal ligand-binding domain-containing protein [uncultured Corynebacterium sp.]|uniref:TetR/AcrR family transcriptional regulator C-terminal ligand-binding domain-containing protein n=2 Tax=Corynebacteriaceae TaxID=1653 RepID=UPI00261231E9|nr:TetR/AcrR family transcriptional regulator C-terminal ligand-binding domain-containing protein [uncultured Corynebacterium sp.]
MAHPNMPGRSGRPLDPSFTPALRQAAAEILAEGNKLTVHALSERTGVGKPAIYRRFPNTAALALAVVADRLTGGQGPDTGSLRGDLTATLRQLRDSLADPAISAGLTLVVVERRLPGVDFGRTLIDPWSDSIALMLRRAVERGEIPPGVDTEAVFLLLLGPLLLHVMLPERPALDDDYLEWFAQAVLDGLGYLPELAHPRCTSQRILDAAGAEYAAHGFHATTLDQISERAEVDPHEMHARFGDKKQWLACSWTMSAQHGRHGRRRSAADH